ncbi:uncharacterized protein LOC116303015 [Actinia tenebrosa]|uniref:Uncharacterized protein LOC116303015 n=1 Tax=Actinia tenebrosa TaxID=6105 RepID=A0A6P8IPM5_ACTTE|nr:uncharacterized protein LOC116303015 [Actinia tenebrosa]
MSSKKTFALEKSEVDATMKEILDVRKVSEKAKKKKAERFFHFLGGGDSPIEAVELALGRNENLQYAQVKSVTEIVKFLDQFGETRVCLEEERCIEILHALVRVLYQCNLLKVLQKFLQLRIPDESICKGIPWKSIYFNSLTILKSMIDFAKKMDTQSKTIVETGTVELLMDYSDGTVDILTCFPAVTGLSSLCTISMEARERVIFCNGLTKFGYLILKDNCQKMHFKAYQQGLKPFQVKELDRVRNVYLHEELMEGKKYVGRSDLSYHVLKKWSKKVQLAAGHIILKIAEQNDRHRKLVFENKFISKAIVKWIKAPVILHGDSEMIDISLRIMATLCFNEEVALQLVEQYGIIEHFEHGVNVPDRDLVLSFLAVILQLSNLGGRCRAAVLENKDIIQSLATFAFSHDKEIQNVLIHILVQLVDNPQSSGDNLVQHGITPKNMLLLTHFYEYDVHIFKTFKQNLTKTCSSWRKEEIHFGRTRHEFIATLDEQQAARLKDMGNDKFKNEEYSVAIDFYSKAIEVCPPAKKGTNNEWKWWVVPAVLYSNRAQAFLKVKEWGPAYVDCKYAIARSMEENDEASKILTKTTYRRARASLELGNYHEALNDIAFCMRKKYKDDNVRSLYQEILVKYREHVGIEPIRRCAVCMEGEGEKLKRCANCNEVYCSRSCQLYAWDTGHKTFCNGKA